MSMPPEVIYSVKDKHNPHSLVNMLPTAMAERVACIPDEYLEMTAEELEKWHSPSKEDRLMRVAFSMELERSSRTRSAFLMTNVFAGLVAVSTFHKSVITNSIRLAYVIKPFPQYMIQLEEMMQLGADRMREILISPALDEDGRFDHKKADLQMKVYEKLTDRTRGTVAQKLQVDSRSVSVKLNEPSTPNDIDKQLKELELQTSGREVAQITHEED